MRPRYFVFGDGGLVEPDPPEPQEPQAWEDVVFEAQVQAYHSRIQNRATAIELELFEERLERYRERGV